MSNFEKLISDVFSLEPASDFCLEMAERSGCTIEYMSIDHLGMSARFKGLGEKSAYLSVSDDSGPELFVRNDGFSHPEKRLITDIKDLEAALKAHFLLGNITRAAAIGGTALDGE